MLETALAFFFVGAMFAGFISRTAGTSRPRVRLTTA